MAKKLAQEEEIGLCLEKELFLTGDMNVAIKLEIPERGTIQLQHAVFSVNGTIALDGIAVPGMPERLKALSTQLSVHLLTTGTHGHLAELERTLGFPIHVVHRGEEKMRYIQQLGPSSVIAFGNSANDTAMLRLAAIGIAILAPEGLSTRAIQNADIIVDGTSNALDLLLKPNRLVATLRN